MSQEISFSPSENSRDWQTCLGHIFALARQNHVILSPKEPGSSHKQIILQNFFLTQMT
jgi:hypothetical protein